MSIEEKIRAEIVRRSGIDPRKLSVCIVPVKSDRKEAGDGTNR